MRLLLVGDLILDEPDPDCFFEPALSVLSSGDIVIGHVEVPHSNRGAMFSTDVPARPADPDHLSALAVLAGGAHTSHHRFLMYVQSGDTVH